MSSPEGAHGAEPSSTCKVSVIVPVYNTGEPIHELIRSLDGQSLPQDEFEVIFVDDGSTDDTGEVLDDLATTHPNWVVRHIPNSGWPGTPRNVGLEIARGEYVAFVDHDDYLGPRGLEKVYEFAQTHQSDIVIAREVGVGRNIGRFMFRRTVVDATFDSDPIVRLLTPHKVYRRGLLQDNDIRFPEGKVRLEDHLFNMQAYFAAKRISIYADYPYYYWTRREGTAHASSDLKDPHEYVEVAVNRVLDVVDRNTEPGPHRDRIKSHWLEKKVLPTLVGASMTGYAPEYREELFAAVHQLVLERYPASSDEQLSFAARLRTHLVREGRLDDLVALAEVEQQITTTLGAQRVSWSRRHATVALEVELSYRDGSPVEFRREGDRVLWAPRGGLGLGDSSDVVLDVTDEVHEAKVLLLAKRRGAPEDFSVRPEGRVELRPAGTPDRWRLVYEGVAQVPLDSLLGLHKRPGRFVVDFNVEFNVLGWRSMRRVAAPKDQPEPQPHPDHADLASFYTTEQGNLSLRVHRPAQLPPELLRQPLTERLAPRRVLRGIRRRWLSGRAHF